jgi:hypothetical protein
MVASSDGVARWETCTVGIEQELQAGECCSVRANARTTFYPWLKSPPDAACAPSAGLTLQLATPPILRTAAVRRPGGSHGSVDLQPLR